MNDAREAPLAATPLFFALQQIVEGLLWINLPLAPDGSPAGSTAAGLIIVYLVIAEVFWPIFMPVAVVLIEPNERRRRFMLLCLTIGAVVAGYLLWWIVAGPNGAVLHDGHIVYLTNYTPSAVLGLSYLASTTLPLMLSSHRTVVMLGAVIFVGSAVAFTFYWEAFVSVWCFFAAAASLVILGHFEVSRRRRLRLAGA
jgi:hypothetical protein